MLGLVHVVSMHLLTSPTASAMVAKRGLFCVVMPHPAPLQGVTLSGENSNMFLRHPRHPQVMSWDFSVTSILCHTFPNPG